MTFSCKRAPAKKTGANHKKLATLTLLSYTVMTLKSSTSPKCRGKREGTSSINVRFFKTLHKTCKNDFGNFFPNRAKLVDHDLDETVKKETEKIIT